MNDELKPCPFCGGKAEFFEDEFFCRYSVVCTECGARTYTYCVERDAMDAWNGRIEPTFTPDELEEIFHRLIGHYPEMSDAGCSAFEKITHWRNRQSIVDKCNAMLKREES